MYKICVAILLYAEYNFEKLIKHWGKPKSPEEALRWRLEFGIVKCILVLLFSEIYHWNKVSRRHSWKNKDNKNAPVKLRRKMAKLIEKSIPEKTEDERISELSIGIEKAIAYLRKIKEQEKFLDSTALQHVQECLEELRKLKV
jgi:hypothetical protein